MKYDIQIEIEPKKPVTSLHLRLDEELVREFKFVVRKKHGSSMTEVATDMIVNFLNDYRTKGQPKQREMF